MSGVAFNNSHIVNGQATLTGWVSGSNDRGTLDIVWSSFFTIFLCTWTVLCLNLPHPEDTETQVLKRKFKWMFWAIVGPELVLPVAIGQYASARRSVKRLRALGHSKWTLRHAFFVDMGGVLLQPKDSVPFVITSRQLAFLVQNDYLALPDISEEEIRDKSKADTLGKFVTLIQASWFLFNLVGRAALGLAISTLELSTGSIVVCTFGTSICWLRKPSDVRRGIVLTTEATTAEILLQAGDAAAQPYTHTPLDFVAKEHFTVGFDVSRFFKVRCDRAERPLRCFPNDRFPDICTFEKFLLFCMSTTYAGLHLLGWKFFFPSRIECILWRVASSITTGVTVSFWVLETIAARYRFGRWDKYLVWLRLKKPDLLANNHIEEGNKTTHGAAAEVPNTSAHVKQGVVVRQNTLQRRDVFEAEQRRQKPLPMWEVLLLIPVVVLYATSRLYQVVEALVGLRELPVAAFKTFDISNVLPHW